MQKDMTQGVKDLLGEPKSAILKISLPMVIAMTVQAVYNIVDGFWVAGLGADQLAGVGLFFPFFFVILALALGIGVGGSSAISRRIGAKDKKGAGNTANHTILLGVIVALLVSIPTLPLLDNLFMFMTDNAEVARMAYEYGRVLWIGSFILIFSNVANGILRGEGDAKRAMYALVIGAVINACMDPVFIYELDLGVAGAAWSTVFSMSVSSLIYIYWIFRKRDTYVDIDLRHFSFDWDIFKEILHVGIPSSLSHILMSVTMIFMNMIVLVVGGTDGVAVFTSGWRIIEFGIIPLFGIGSGIVAVTGAAYGARNKRKLRESYMYAIKIGFIIEAFIACAIFLFAPQVARLFTYSPDSVRIFEDLVTFLRIGAFIFIGVPIGLSTGAMFRGIGKGFRSLAISIIRNLVFRIPLAYMLGIYMGFGLVGIWSSIVLGNLIASVIAFVWGRVTIDRVF